MPEIQRQKREILEIILSLFVHLTQHQQRINKPTSRRCSPIALRGVGGAFHAYLICCGLPNVLQIEFQLLSTK